MYLQFTIIHKSETRQHVIDFINLIENQFNCNVKTIRSDNGPEFTIPMHPKAFYIKQVVLKHLSKMLELRENINLF